MVGQAVLLNLNILFRVRDNFAFGSPDDLRLFDRSIWLGGKPRLARSNQLSDSGEAGRVDTDFITGRDDASSI